MESCKPFSITAEEPGDRVSEDRTYTAEEYFAGLDVEYERGWDAAWDAGYATGFREGHEAGYDEGVKAARHGG